MSAKFSLNAIDWNKIGKWALIAIAWAIFTYFEAEVFPTIDRGTYAPIAMTINSVLVNIVSKWLSWPTAPIVTK